MSRGGTGVLSVWLQAHGVQTVYSVHQLFATLTDLLGTDRLGARHQTTRCPETWYSAFGRAVWLYVCTTCCLANRRWVFNINPHTTIFVLQAEVGQHIAASGSKTPGSMWYTSGGFTSPLRMGTMSSSSVEPPVSFFLSLSVCLCLSYNVGYFDYFKDLVNWI